MIVVKKIVWDFEGTEFEECDYNEARKIAVLPNSLKIKEEDLDSDADREDILEFLSETYNFEAKSIKLEEDD